MLSHGRSDGMQNPMSAMGILDKFMKKKSRSGRDRSSVPAGKFAAAGVAGWWQVLSRCHTVSVSHRPRAGRAKGLSDAL